MRRCAVGPATRSEPNDISDYSIDYNKMLESLTTIQTTTSATTSTSGETPALSSSRSDRNARRQRHTPPPPTIASPTTTKDRHTRGLTSGPTTQKLTPRHYQKKWLMRPVFIATPRILLRYIGLAQRQAILVALGSLVATKILVLQSKFVSLQQGGVVAMKQ